MLNNEESRYPSGDKRPPKTSRNEHYYNVKTPINQDSLPSWESLFVSIGEKPPRRNRARCTLHNGDSQMSLSIDEERGIFHCFVCGAGGDKIGFIQKYFDCDFKGALAWLGLAPGKPPKLDMERKRRTNILRNFEAWRRRQARTISLKIFEANKTIQTALDRLETDRDDERARFALGIVYPQLSKLEFHADLLSGGEPAEILEAFFAWEGCV